MTTIPTFAEHPALKRGANMYRWPLILEIAEMAEVSDYESWKKQFADSNLKSFKEVPDLLYLWGFMGWEPVFSPSGQWKYEEAFNKNHGNRNLISFTGLRFAKLLKLIDYSSKTEKFSKIFNECILTLQKIRMFVYKYRWENYALEVLSGATIPNITPSEKKAIVSDIFRLLCFDFLVRNQTLSKQQIYLISGCINNPNTYNVKDLASFRTWVDRQSEALDRGQLIVNISPTWSLSNKSYHFQEFNEYEKTHHVKIFSTLEGDFNNGYRYNGKEDCFTELQGKLEELI